MKTPICDFVTRYAESKSVRLHMPGHKGKGFLGIEHLDITEIEGADELYNARGIIKESEENAASLFATGKTFYSAEGSTLTIRAMLYLAIIDAKNKGRSSTLVAGRNAHKALMTAAALLDFDVDWIFSDDSESLVSCKITPEMLEKKLASLEEKPAAVYITSPDYLGNTCDVEGLAKVCRENNTLLLVDNAHGAYLAFLENSEHPIAKGAHMCADSAHKTLPVLTGGAYLHISKDFEWEVSDLAENALSLFASSSPSYLILESLDKANDYIENGYRAQLHKTVQKVNALKESLARGGYTIVGDEPLKLTVKAKDYGYTGTELSKILSCNNIVCEFSDPDFTVMMITPETKECELVYLESVLLSLERKTPIEKSAPLCKAPCKVMSIKQAMMSKSVERPMDECVGKVLAHARLGCPPAVPILVCGEIIDKEHLKLFEYYGIEKCRVVE